MSEYIHSYELDNKFQAASMDRKEFYDKQIEAYKNNGKPTKAVGLFTVLLITEKGDIILQKRSPHKRHNAYLIDKSVGGHIEFGDTVYYTAMLECVQELRVPAVVLRESEGFIRTLGLLKDALESVAVLELIDNNIYQIDTFFDDEKVTIAKNIWFFLGIYGGPIKPVDGEASGVLYYKWEDLLKEMKKSPDIFTPDLHLLTKEFKPQIEELLQTLKK